MNIRHVIASGRAWTVVVFMTVIVVLAIAAHVVLHLAGAGAAGLPWRRLAAESAMFLLVLLAVGVHPTAQRVLGGIGRTRLIAVVALSGLILLGQLLTVRRVVSYPFTNWGMYTHRAPTTTYQEYIAEFESGRREHFPFRSIHPTPSIRSFMDRFRPEMRRALDESLPEDVRAGARDRTAESMRVLMRIYNSIHPEDRVTAVDAIVCTVDPASFTGKESVDRRLVVRVEAD